MTGSPIRDDGWRGFTLTELLVSLGILSVLGALLVPALAKGVGQVRNTSCKSNLRQIGLAMTMYVADFNRYPSEAEWGGSAFPWYWNQRITPYAGSSTDVFVCPSKRSNRQVFSRFSYGYNSHGSGKLGGPNLGLGQARFKRILPSQINAPSDMIAVGDNGLGATSDWLLNPNLDFNSIEDVSLASWLPAARHNGGSNILFCDGHVEHAAQARWIEKSVEVRRRWNNDNRSRADVWQ